MVKCVFVFLVFAVAEGVGFTAKNNLRGDKLVAVVTLFRHGDRSPSKSFPNDLYFNEFYWPMGYGQLTNAGKARMYELGKWFRKRYNSFLPDEYSPKDVYVRSTDPARCLMSAYAVLAGLFPPKGSQTFSKDLPWQPIPVHTIPIEEDEVLSMSKKCPKYVNLLKETMSSVYIKKLTFKFFDFFNYVSKHTGWNPTDISQVATLQTNLDVYASYNTSFIPPWTKFLDKRRLVYLAGVNHQRHTLTPELKRLLTGPFWTNFLSHFDNVVNNVTDTPKFLMLSAHDTTIVSLLNCMEVFDLVPPGFGASLIWELRRRHDGSYYLNLFYKKPNSEADVIAFKGCIIDCDYNDFKDMLSGLTVDGREWEKECEDVIQANKTRPARVKKPFFT